MVSGIEMTCRSKNIAQLLNGKRWRFHMKHLVTVGTDGTHIAGWHYTASFSNLRNRDEVVNVNEPVPDVAVARFEVKAADGTAAAEMPNT